MACPGDRNIGAASKLWSWFCGIPAPHVGQPEALDQSPGDHGRYNVGSEFTACTPMGSPGSGDRWRRYKCLYESLVPPGSSRMSANVTVQQELLASFAAGWRNHSCYLVAAGWTEGRATGVAGNTHRIDAGLSGFCGNNVGIRSERG